MLSRKLLSQSSPAAAILPLQFPFPFRNRSSRSGKLIEINLDSALHSSSSASSFGDGDDESGAIGLRGLEESINCILALRYTPDWIPFLPGASFWVPPRTLSSVQYLGSLSSPFPENESLSFASPRGWPCFDSLSLFDASSTTTLEFETVADLSRPRVVEIQVQVLTPSQGDSESGDD